MTNVIDSISELTQRVNWPTAYYQGKVAAIANTFSRLGFIELLIASDTIGSHGLALRPTGWTVRPTISTAALWATRNSFCARFTAYTICCHGCKADECSGGFEFLYGLWCRVDAARFSTMSRTVRRQFLIQQILQEGSSYGTTAD